MRAYLCLFGAVAALAANPAMACMEDPLPHAMLFDYRPSTVPDDSVAVLVQPIATIPQSYSVRAKVLDGRGALQPGLVVTLDSENLSSCVGFGRLNKPAFVVIRRTIEKVPAKPLVARAYDRSWLDTFWRLFGWETFTPTGSPLEDPMRGMQRKAQG